MRSNCTSLPTGQGPRSEEHTSELQSRSDLVCRLLLEKKKKKQRECAVAQTRHDFDARYMPQYHTAHTGGKTPSRSSATPCCSATYRSPVSIMASSYTS